MPDDTGFDALIVAVTVFGDGARMQPAAALVRGLAGLSGATQLP